MVMRPEYLEKLFSGLSYVSSITFTGGEPSLVPEVIEQTIEIAEKHGVGFGNFYIATNAVATSDEFMLAIMRLHNYCDDNECSQVNWSNDDYHPDMELTENTRKLSVFAFASAKYDGSYKPGLIGEGRAEDLGADRTNDREVFEVDEDGRITEGTVYLNCEGNIIGGCDWSFDSQREPENIVSTVADYSPEKVIEFTEAGE
jgi:hypothetical protein